MFLKADHRGMAQIFESHGSGPPPVHPGDEGSIAIHTLDPRRPSRELLFPETYAAAPYTDAAKLVHLMWTDGRALPARWTRPQRKAHRWPGRRWRRLSKKKPRGRTAATGGGGLLHLAARRRRCNGIQDLALRAPGHNGNLRRDDLA
jgi:hypothetical protein